MGGRNPFWTKTIPQVTKLLPPGLLNRLRKDKRNLAMLVTLATLTVKVQGARGNIIMITHKTVRNIMQILLTDNKRRVCPHICIFYALTELCDAKLLEPYCTTSRSKVYMLRRGSTLWKLLENVRDTETLLEAYTHVKEIIHRTYTQQKHQQ